MLRPSAAPRWKITTSRLLVVPGLTAPHAARVRKDGIAAVPTIAIAPPFMNARRVMLMLYASLTLDPWVLAFGSWLLAFSF